MRYVADAEVLIDRQRVDVARNARQLEQRLNLAGKGQPVALQGVDQRLLSHAIAGQHKTLATRVPNGQREHAAQLLEAIEAVLLVEMDDCLGIGRRAKSVPASDEPCSQFGEIVDLAVHGQNPAPAR